MSSDDAPAATSTPVKAEGAAFTSSAPSMASTPAGAALAALLAASATPAKSSASGAAMSDEAKLKLCRKYIMEAPPGEFRNVVDDIRVLLDNDELLKQGASTAFALYNEEQFTPVTVEGVDRQVLITRYGRIGHDRYFDPSTKKIFKFDHIKREASNIVVSETTALIELTEAARQVFDAAVKNYVEDHYPDGAFAVYAPKEDVIVICIEDHKFNPDNFWSGRIRSEWQVTKKTGQIVGKIFVDVHYYEDGNLHLKTQRDILRTIAVEAPESMAAHTVKIIRSVENEFQTAVNENYQTMSSTTFKALRRVLPATRSKMEWEALDHYQIGKEIAARPFSSPPR